MSDNIIKQEKLPIAVLEKYKEKLCEALQKLLDEYQQRIERNPKDPKSIGLADAATVLATGIALGAAVGTVIPGPGTAAGAAGGVIAGGVVLGVTQAYKCRLKKKLRNARKVIGFFQQKDTFSIFKEVSGKVVEDRKDIIAKLKDPQKDSNCEIIARYLAVNIIAAVKHNPDPTDYLSIMTQGLEDTRSKKEHSQKLQGQMQEVNHSRTFTTKDIANFPKKEANVPKQAETEKDLQPLYKL